MTITIDLPEATLTALRAEAAAQGRAAEEIAAEYLSDLYDGPEDEAIAVEEALSELETGKGRLFSEFADDFAARFTVSYTVAVGQLLRCFSVG